MAAAVLLLPVPSFGGLETHHLPVITKRVLLSAFVAAWLLQQPMFSPEITGCPIESVLLKTLSKG
jgi:hypothetical protein